jgi:hypothetical protein
VYTGGLLSEDAKEMVGGKETDEEELDSALLDRAGDMTAVELSGV